MTILNTISDFWTIDLVNGYDSCSNERDLKYIIPNADAMQTDTYLSSFILQPPAPPKPLFDRISDRFKGV